MDFFLTFLGGTGGVLFGAWLIKLYIDWKDKKAQKEFENYLEDLRLEIEQYEFQTDEEGPVLEKKPPSDPEAPTDRPL